jgi:hypothetical protein
MMRLHQIRRPNKKPLLIFAGIVVAVIALCVGGWWYNANRSTTDYRTQLATFSDATKKEIKALADQFKSLTKEGDAKKATDELTKLNDKLVKQANGLPSLPQLFGVTLTPQQDIQKRGEIIQRLKQLAGDTQVAKELLEYQNQTALALQEVTTKTGPNAEQQKALADAWGAMIGKLQAIKPPAQAQSAHQQIISAVNAAQGHIAALPDLFNKKDVAGFAAKQKEIETHINALRALGDGIQVLNTKQDKIIARDYQNLQNILK